MVHIPGPASGSWAFISLAEGGEQAPVRAPLPPHPLHGPAPKPSLPSFTWTADEVPAGLRTEIQDLSSSLRDGYAVTLLPQRQQQRGRMEDIVGGGLPGVVCNIDSECTCQFSDTWMHHPGKNSACTAGPPGETDDGVEQVWDSGESSCDGEYWEHWVWSWSSEDAAADGIYTEDGIYAEDGVKKEDKIYAGNGIYAEDGIHTEDCIYADSVAALEQEEHGTCARISEKRRAVLGTRKGTAGCLLKLLEEDNDSPADEVKAYDSMPASEVQCR